MTQNKNNFIPVLTSKAGASLTLANWQEIGIETVAYSLDALLMKPGLAVLNSLPDLRSYCGWQGTIALNASLLRASKGIYAIRSSFDGSIIRINDAELLALIVRLQPDIVILPPDSTTYLSQFYPSLAKTVKIFSAGNDPAQRPDSIAVGSYLFYDQEKSFTDFIQQLRKHEGKAIYLSGEFNVLQSLELIKQNLSFIESDKPAADAFIGQVYTQQTSIALLDSQMAHQHEVIDEQCACPTCEQKLTRAYLHHLLMQTPLLCQRLLIQHNVSMGSASIDFFSENAVNRSKINRV